MRFLNKTCLLFCLVSCLALGSAKADIDIKQQSTPEYEAMAWHGSGETYKFNIRYPVITSFILPSVQKKRVNDAILQFVQELSAGDLKVFFDNENSPQDMEELGLFSKSELTLDFHLVLLDAAFVSIQFDRYFYGAGAMHGMSSEPCFNYDIKKRRMAELSDFFDTGAGYLPKISEIVIRDLKRQATADNQPDDVLNRWIEDGAAPSLENLGNFTFDGNLLTVHFGAYQVGPGSWGLRHVVIPISDLLR